MADVVRFILQTETRIMLYSVSQFNFTLYSGLCRLLGPVEEGEVVNSIIEAIQINQEVVYVPLGGMLWMVLKK